MQHIDMNREEQFEEVFNLYNDMLFRHVSMRVAARACTAAVRINVMQAHRRLRHHQRW